MPLFTYYVICNYKFYSRNKRIKTGKKITNIYYIYFFRIPIEKE